jgi:hypothetical protein
MKLVGQHGLINKIIACVKNLNAMTITLKCVIKCEVFGLDENF